MCNKTIEKVSEKTKIIFGEITLQHKYITKPFLGFGLYLFNLFQLLSGGITKNVNKKK